MDFDLLAQQQLASRKTAVVSALVNLGLAVVKCILGFLSNSSALIADGVHSLADLLSDLFTYLVLKVAHNGADDTHPYGHGKFETFGALVMSVLLVVTAAGIGWSAVHKYLSSATELKMGAAALAAAALSICANETLFRYCRRIGEAANSKIVVANAWHHRADGLSSVAALIGIALSLAGYPVFDAIAAIIVSCMLIHVAWEIGKDAFDELVDAAVADDLQDAMLDVIQKTAGVLNAHSLRARKLGGQIFVDVHVEVQPYLSVSEGHAIAELVESELKRYVQHINDVVVHIDADDESHFDCPVFPNRVELETMVQQAIAAHVPQARFERLMLHFILDTLEAEVFLSTKQPIAPQAITALRQAILRPEGPFSKVSIHHTLWHDTGALEV